MSHADNEATPVGIPDAVLASAESLIARAFALDPEGAAAFAPLQGRVIALDILGLDTRISLVPTTDRIRLFGRYGSDPDCVIAGAPLALLRLMSTENKGAELGVGDVTISGDSTLAHDLTRAVAGLDLDWEEQLSRLFGDPLAHRIGSALRASGDWGRRSARTLVLDLKEYLEEEARLVPTRFELEHFLAAVDTLRDDTERLAARLDRLQRVARDRGSKPQGGDTENARHQGLRRSQ